MIFSTTTFIDSVTEIQSHSKFYSCFGNEFNSELVKKFNLPSYVSIFKSSDKEIYKARLKNCNGRGKSYGFRVIFLFDKINNSTYFLFAYPKYGKLGLDSITDLFRNELIKDLIYDLDCGNLHSIIIKKGQISFTKVTNSPLELVNDEEE